MTADSVADYLESLNKLAIVEVDPSKGFKLYTRSADMVFRQACIYRSEGDIEKAYILFLKYSTLVLTELPKHPQYRENAGLMAPLRTNVITALDVLEKTKPQIVERFKQLEKERLALAAREREARETWEREAEAKRLADRMLKNQEELRRMRLEEVKRFAEQERRTSLLDGSVDLAKPLASSSSSLLAGSNSNIDYSKPSSPVGNLDGAEPINHISPPPTKTSKYFLENGSPLRTVHIPHVIIDRFMELAIGNTRKNLETCGVLAGKLSHDAFTITSLIVPKQTSTSDTVAMLNEEEVVEVQITKDLYTLGWIHTHPTQQCFMSSVDLHTHFSYQMMMAEAIAIVVAPTQTPNFGIFRLTDPPGKGVISQCSHRGFHPHDSTVYREISGPDGHAKFSSTLPLEVIDLR